MINKKIYWKIKFNWLKKYLNFNYSKKINKYIQTKTIIIKIKQLKIY